MLPLWTTSSSFSNQPFRMMMMTTSIVHLLLLVLILPVMIPSPSGVWDYRYSYNKGIAGAAINPNQTEYLVSALTRYKNALEATFIEFTTKIQGNTSDVCELNRACPRTTSFPPINFNESFEDHAFAQIKAAPVETFSSSSSSSNSTAILAINKTEGCELMALQRTWRNQSSQFPQGQLLWQYYGSVDNLFAQFPENNWNCSQKFIPEVRPWFTSGSTGQKDVVILIDVSSRYLGQPRFGAAARLAIAIAAAHQLLNMLSFYDFVAILPYSTTVNASITPAPVRATIANIELLHTALDTIALDMNNGGDQASAVWSATEMLHHAQVTKVATAGCTQTIVLFTGGGQEGSATVRNVMANHGDKILFAFLISNSGHPTGIRQNIDDLLKATCSYDGILRSPSTKDEALLDIRIFRSYFSTLMENKFVRWSELYEDAQGQGLVLSGSIPVFDRVMGNMEGLLAVDVPFWALNNGTALTVDDINTFLLTIQTCTPLDRISPYADYSIYKLQRGVCDTVNWDVDNPAKRLLPLWVFIFLIGLFVVLIPIVHQVCNCCRSEWTWYNRVYYHMNVIYGCCTCWYFILWLTALLVFFIHSWPSILFRHSYTRVLYTVDSFTENPAPCCDKICDSACGVSVATNVTNLTCSAALALQIPGPCSDGYKCCQEHCEVCNCHMSCYRQRRQQQETATTTTTHSQQTKQQKVGGCKTEGREKEKQQKALHQRRRIMALAQKEEEEEEEQLHGDFNHNFNFTNGKQELLQASSKKHPVVTRHFVTGYSQHPTTGSDSSSTNHHSPYPTNQMIMMSNRKNKDKMVTTTTTTTIFYDEHGQLRGGHPWGRSRKREREQEEENGGGVLSTLLSPFHRVMKALQRSYTSGSSSSGSSSSSSSSSSSGGRTSTSSYSSSSSSTSSSSTSSGGRTSSSSSSGGRTSSSSSSSSSSSGGRTSTSSGSSSSSSSGGRTSTSSSSSSSSSSGGRTSSSSSSGSSGSSSSSGPSRYGSSSSSSGHSSSGTSSGTSTTSGGSRPSTSSGTSTSGTTSSTSSSYGSGSSSSTSTSGTRPSSSSYSSSYVSSPSTSSSSSSIHSTSSSSGSGSSSSYSSSNYDSSTSSSSYDYDCYESCSTCCVCASAVSSQRCDIRCGLCYSPRIAISYIYQQRPMYSAFTYVCDRDDTSCVSKLHAQFPVGSIHEGWVNPEHPTELAGDVPLDLGSIIPSAIIMFIAVAMVLPLLYPPWAFKCYQCFMSVDYATIIQDLEREVQQEIDIEKNKHKIVAIPVASKIPPVSEDDEDVVAGGGSAQNNNNPGSYGSPVNLQQVSIRIDNHNTQQQQQPPFYTNNPQEQQQTYDNNNTYNNNNNSTYNNYTHPLGGEGGYPPPNHPNSNTYGYGLLQPYGPPPPVVVVPTTTVPPPSANFMAADSTNTNNNFDDGSRGMISWFVGDWLIIWDDGETREFTVQPGGRFVVDCDTYQLEKPVPEVSTYFMWEDQRTQQSVRDIKDNGEFEEVWWGTTEKEDKYGKIIWRRKRKEEVAQRNNNVGAPTPVATTSPVFCAPLPTSPTMDSYNVPESAGFNNSNGNNYPPTSLYTAAAGTGSRQQQQDEEEGAFSSPERGGVMGGEGDEDQPTTSKKKKKKHHHKEKDSNKKRRVALGQEIKEWKAWFQSQHNGVEPNENDLLGDGVMGPKYQEYQQLQAEKKKRHPQDDEKGEEEEGKNELAGSGGGIEFQV